MADLSSILVAAGGADQQTRSQAEQALQEWENKNFPEFVQALAAEVATEGKPARQLAAIHFKNMLQAKNEQMQVNKHNRWKGLDATVRGNVKQSLLTAFRSPEPRIPNMAAVASSEIAAVELPYNEWPEFLPTVLANVTAPDLPDSVKIASLECLGFTCERLAYIDGPEISEQNTNEMLTAIVDGVQPTRADAVRKVAADALRNSLLFVQKNMEKPQERDAIMKTICDATQAQGPEVRRAAFECIAQIAVQFYEKLQNYMTKIFELTTQAIQKDEEAVAIAAMEFWSTLCEVEQEIIDDSADATERGLQVERQCVRYIAAAVDHLIPLLTEALTKQDEEADEDTFNLHMAGTSCLSLVSQTVEGLVVPAVMPFVQANIQNENWRFREAAIMAFASILDGPSSEVIGPAVAQSIPVLLQALSDSHVMVRDTAAYCVQRICLLHIRSIPNDLFPNLMQALITKCQEGSPKVASQSCSAIHNLAAAFADDPSEERGTNALSQYMPTLLSTLLAASDRKDVIETTLRRDALTAIAVLIQYSAPDVKSLLVQLMPAILERMDQVHKSQGFTNEERDAKEELQQLLCAIIQVLCQKLEKENIIPLGDTIMTQLLQVLQARNATSHTEAFTAIAAVIDVLENDFEKYAQALHPYLLQGLRNFQAYQVCITAVGVVSDVSRAIEGKIQPFCDDIMQALVESLKDSSIHRSVKPPVLSCFGDVALAIGGAFEPYLQFSAMLLMQASNTQAPPEDEDLIEYVNFLRESVLEAYTGIVRGLQEGSKLHLFLPYVASVMQFLQQLSQDPNRDDYVLARAIGLIGDLSHAMGTQIRAQIQTPFVEKLIRDGLESGDENNIQVAQWASQHVQALVSS